MQLHAIANHLRSGEWHFASVLLEQALEVDKDALRGLWPQISARTKSTRISEFIDYRRSMHINKLEGKLHCANGIN